MPFEARAPILVVDDTNDQLLTVVGLLSDDGIPTGNANSLASAVEALGRQNWGGVSMDSLEGDWETLAHEAISIGYPPSALLLLTGNPTEYKSVAARELGVTRVGKWEMASGLDKWVKLITTL